LAVRFDAVSVREDSAIDTCERGWGISPVRMPDPTFLLERADYERLAKSAQQDPKTGEGVFVYVLDTSPSVVELLGLLPPVLGAPLQTLAVPSAAGVPARASGLTPRPSIEQWITSIRDADAVITDSFHGTVFALIFNRPFVAVGNVERGMARFESLLGRFGLEAHLVQTGGDAAGHAQRVAETLRREIDWSAVNETIASERERGLSFLRTELADARA